MTKPPAAASLNESKPTVVWHAPRSADAYRLSPQAEQDLREIWSYVADDASPERADRLLDAIFDRLDMLVDLPRIGRRRPEFGPDVRSFAVENHVIYYREQGELLVSRILHGRRDQLAAWQESAEGAEPES